MRVLRFGGASEIVRFGKSLGPGLPAFDASTFETQRADIHLCAVLESGEAQGRCSLWWKQVPTQEGFRVGVIGHYAAASDEGAAAVLDAAQERLREAGCTLAIGPMNGNTWRSYRFVTERGEQPSFFLEPTNPPEWPRQFEKKGFSSVASYFSALNTDMSRADPRQDAIEKKIAETGVVIRRANTDLRLELEKIYAVSRVSFKQNFLYTEISRAEFVAMYEPVLAVARPELVLMAESGGECVGYLFAVPDFAQKARGLDVDTFIVKTVSILPRLELRGLGTLLVARVQRLGHELGFRRCIHALMFEENISMNISRHYARVMRKYTLYSKDLAG